MGPLTPVPGVIGPAPGTPARMVHNRTAPSRVPGPVVDLNRLWVDNPLRALAQRTVEAPVLLELGGRLDGGRALELGPGRLGTGLRLALSDFGAAHVDGIELHAASVRAVSRRTADLGDRVRAQQGDATALPFPDESFDAVLCFHLLHHAEHWRLAVAEAARVLRPGGRLYVAEMTARFVDSRLLRAVSHHPRDGDRPTPGALASACRAAGLVVLGSQVRLGCWVGLVARCP